jgi:hypothetical protein
MSDKPTPDKSKWPWPTEGREPPPVMGRNRLFITEESAAHVANVHSSFDTARGGRMREVDSEAPYDEHPAKWTGDATSDL